MPFLIFERIATDGKSILRPTGEEFSLAGYNLLYKAWEKKGRPVNEGWHVTADSLIKIHTNDNLDGSTRCLVIDFDPKAEWRTGLIELLDVYAYTWGDDHGEASWTPLMLRFRDACYEEYDPKNGEKRKSKILSGIPEPAADSPDFVEFLYLQGSWNWGKNGMTNAAFIHDNARDYFRKFF